MAKVFVVCGAGASSTFLAMKLRTLSNELGRDFQFFPSALDTLRVEPGDLVIVASHIATHPKVDALRSEGAVVMSLTESALMDVTAKNAMELLLQTAV